MAKDFTELLTSDEFKNSLKNTAKDLAIPAIIATLGSGAVGSYLESKKEKDNESKSERRKRILKAALLPALTAATASAAFGGAKALSDVDTKKAINNMWENTDIIGNTIEYGAPIGVGLGVGGKTSGLDTKSLFKKDPDKALLRFFTENAENADDVFELGTKNNNSKLVKALRKIPVRPAFKGSPLRAIVGTGAGLGSAWLADTLLEPLY